MKLHRIIFVFAILVLANFVRAEEAFWMPVGDYIFLSTPINSTSGPCRVWAEVQMPNDVSDGGYLSAVFADGTEWIVPLVGTMLCMDDLQPHEPFAYNAGSQQWETTIKYALNGAEYPVLIGDSLYQELSREFGTFSYGQYFVRTMDKEGELHTFDFLSGAPVDPNLAINFVAEYEIAENGKIERVFLADVVTDGRVKAEMVETEYQDGAWVPSGPRLLVTVICDESLTYPVTLFVTGLTVPETKSCTAGDFYLRWEFPHNPFGAYLLYAGEPVNGYYPDVNGWGMLYIPRVEYP